MDLETTTVLGYLTAIGGFIYMLQNGACGRWMNEISPNPIPDTMYKRHTQSEPVVAEQEDSATDDEHLETDSLESQEIESESKSESHED